MLGGCTSFSLSGLGSQVGGAASWREVLAKTCWFQSPTVLPCPPPEISAKVVFWSGSPVLSVARVSQILVTKRRTTSSFGDFHSGFDLTELHFPPTTCTQTTIGPLPTLTTRAQCLARASVGGVQEDGEKSRYCRRHVLVLCGRGPYLASTGVAGSPHFPLMERCDRVSSDKLKSRCSRRRGDGSAH